MKFEIFMNFNGNCREAMDFYAAAFDSKVENLMTFGQAPADPNMPIKESEKDFIMYGEVKIGDKTIMFMDGSSDWPITFGNNISPTINVQDNTEVDKLFNALKEGGKVHSEPQKTFFSERYAMIEDKFGVLWQILGPMPTPPQA